MITVVFGPNAYARQQRLRALVQDFSAAYGSAGIERRDGETLEPAELPGLFQGMSLFSAEKLVIIRDAAANKAVWEALEPYVSAPGDAALHVALVERDIDKRTKTFKALQKHAEVVECKELSAGELTHWLVQRSEGRLERRLAQLLVQRVGADQQRLANELDKLMLHEHISERHIEALVEASPEGSAFELLDLVFAGRVERIRPAIAGLKTAEDPYRLFALLVSNLHVAAALVADTGRTPQQVASDLGVHPFVAGKLAQARRRLTLAKVREAVRVLADTDTALKTTGQDPWVLLTNALIKIAA